MLLQLRLHRLLLSFLACCSLAAAAASFPSFFTLLCLLFHRGSREEGRRTQTHTHSPSPTHSHTHTYTSTNTDAEPLTRIRCLRQQQEERRRQPSETRGRRVTGTDRLLRKSSSVCVSLDQESTLWKRQHDRTAATAVTVDVNDDYDSESDGDT